MPRRIAIITSPTGAAIRDMLNILGRRARGVEITLFPALVQGTPAAQDILRALRLVEKIGTYDVLIVGRGGGSMEDLWAFNDETLVRAIANCRIPTVSAVGHEIDFTICDFVADLRAPTPSAAAELVVQNAGDLIDRLGMVSRQMKMLMSRKIQFLRQKIISVERGLIDPKKRLADLAQRCDDLMTRLQAALLNQLRLKKFEVGKFAAILETLSPLAVVSRGYSIVECQGKVIREASRLKIGDEIRVRFSRGTAQARIESIDLKKGV